MELTNQIIKDEFPELWEYIKDNDVTDFDYNCGNIWRTTVYEVPQLIESKIIDKKYMERFAAAAGKSVNCNFNPKEHTFYAETETLRITCVHESQARSGLAVCIRKFEYGLRCSREELIEKEYFSEEIMNMIDNSLASGRSLFICGLPGHGKTEALKIFASHLPKNEKVVTIQDVGEINYSVINPGASCNELKVMNGNYKDCIETSLRLNPSAILYGESRGRDVIYVLEIISNGIPAVLTMHEGDVCNLTDRVLNMLNDRRDSDRIVNQLYNDIGLAILVKRKSTKDGKLIRYIDQACFYERKEDKNIQVLAVENGKLYKERIPDFLREDIESKIDGSMFESNTVGG